MRFVILLCVLLITSSSVAARAQLLLTLDTPFQAAQPGDTLDFTGTLLNSGPAEIFLNGATYTLGANDLTLDLTPFLYGAPLSLLPAQSWSGDLFTVDVDPDLPFAPALNLFTITGGSNANDQLDLATVSFGVGVPEPNGLALVLVGLAIGSVLLCRRYQWERQR